MFNEILPTIRKTDGAYLTDKKIENLPTDPDLVIGMVLQLKRLRAESEIMVRYKRCGSPPALIFIVRALMQTPFVFIKSILAENEILTFIRLATIFGTLQNYHMTYER